jgi:hypothetical protein
MIAIKDVLSNCINSVVPFKIGYRKIDGTYSFKENILGSTKPPTKGVITLFQGRQPFTVYVDLIVHFENENVIHA